MWPRFTTNSRAFATTRRLSTSSSASMRCLSISSSCLNFEAPSLASAEGEAPEEAAPRLPCRTAISTNAGEHVCVMCELGSTYTTQVREYVGVVASQSWETQPAVLDKLYYPGMFHPVRLLDGHRRVSSPVNSSSTSSKSMSQSFSPLGGARQ